MIDNEIIKALECCTKTEFISDCAKCEMLAFDCKDTLIENALDLINRQKAEIERLLKIIADKEYSCMGLATQLKITNELLKTAKSEAIKEFAERVKTETFLAKAVESVEHVIWMNEIDNIVKEMTEVETNQRKEDEGK